ncbi:hypothetical protein CMO84_03940 [Candidatus Woesearchaeota archaeon]|jgi:hypothetical protein|nr:hypothetical protein [Candidatus Woesearchaeota archaeon]MDP6740588.1 hypothetical protein [Planctomycetota bacterium]MDP6938051.1 hypothetical protein [Planctomycetota bacterium]
MNPGARCWVLNLDAEHELETVGAYTPSAHMRSVVAAQQRKLLGTLLGPDDILLTEANLDKYTASGTLRGMHGLAWCPTPRALSMLNAVGAIAEAAPSLDVLRRVNARPFASEVRAPLVQASFEKHLATHLDMALEQLAKPTAQGWLVRRAFGAAGRGRQRLAVGKPPASDQAWLVASLRLGPLTIEPWVEIETEYTRSGWVGVDGTVLIAPPCFQKTTREGAWERTDTAAPDLVTREDDRLLQQAVEQSGRALASAGYFGAFGIDAFRHRLQGGNSRRLVLNPMSEINARFTMDWTLGMGSRTPHRETGGRGVTTT